MDTAGQFLRKAAIAATVVVLLLTCVTMVLGVKHVTYEESCGGNDTCDRNKGLFCDVDKKVCLCSEGASWIRDFGAEYHCRVKAGKKCGRSLMSPKCEGGLHCEPVKEGDLAETVCKCPPEQDCIELRSAGPGANGTAGNYATNYVPDATTFRGLVCFWLILAQF